MRPTVKHLWLALSLMSVCAACSDDPAGLPLCERPREIRTSLSIATGGSATNPGVVTQDLSARVSFKVPSTVTVLGVEMGVAEASTPIWDLKYTISMLGDSPNQDWVVPVPLDALLAPLDATDNSAAPLGKVYVAARPILNCLYTASAAHAVAMSAPFSVDRAPPATATAVQRSSLGR